ncbi:MAG TPA: GGDEF domain-containing protein [Gammaproteobacteria bacterium]|nr:GGDEF domain-containing protein [Gammaproteobacteria bacterium]
MSKQEDENEDEPCDENYRSIATILDSLDALVYVSDMQTYELLFTNEYGRSIWGDIQGKTCWKVLQKNQDGPCSFCTNDRLLDESGMPTGVYVWEFQNTVNKHWYQCRDLAIRWTDGRLVRLEIATDITDRKRVEEELRAAKQYAEELAQKDELTGLRNRRAFFEQGRYIFEQSKRFAHPVSVIMMDIDHFKLVNDNYGHSAGDRVLQALAEPLQALVREVDVVSRIGGEEFAFALPETGLEDAVNLAERLRAEIENIVVESDGDKIKITASFGVATSSGNDENIDALLIKADDALYVAKKKGRNQVTTYY